MSHVSLLWHSHSGIAVWSTVEASFVSLSVHSIWCRWSIVLIFWNRNVRYLNRTCWEMSKTSTWRRLSKQSSPLLNEWRGQSSLSSEKIRHSFGLKIHGKSIMVSGVYLSYWKLTLHIYSTNYVLAWSKLRWKNHGQFLHLSQWLRIVRILSAQRHSHLALMNLQQSGLILFRLPWDICKRTGEEVYCLMKYHRIHHHFFVSVAIVLCSDNNSGT